MKTSGSKLNTVGLIGFGYWGKKIFFTLRENKKVDFIYIVDPNISREDSLALSKYKKVVISDLNTILNLNEISHILIATPEETHFKIAQDCLKKKKHVFVEKPLCLKTSQAKKLTKIARASNLNLFTDYVFLHDTFVRKIVEIISYGDIGELHHIHSVRHSVGTTKPNITVFDDLAIHDIYLGQLFFSNTIKKVQVIPEKIISSQINQGQVLYSFNQKKQSNSKTLFAEYSWIQPETKRIMTFIGSSGSLSWDRNLPHLLMYSKDKVQKISVKIKQSALHESIDKFLKNSFEIIKYEKDIRIIEKMRELSK